jgi:hypothetical protein
MNLSYSFLIARCGRGAFSLILLCYSPRCQSRFKFMRPYAASLGVLCPRKHLR